MNKTIQSLTSCRQTAKRISELVNKFAGDLNLIRVKWQNKNRSLASLDLMQFYDFVKSMPFKPDEKPIEVIARPYFLASKYFNGRDCKKATILMASYLKLKKIPFQLVGSSNRPTQEIHHIFTRGFIGGKFRDIDATYPENRIFVKKHNTNEVVFYDSRQ
ncbi:MAG: hypothetical protein WBM07_17060 [Chitinivibrionales bacterium]